MIQRKRVMALILLALLVAGCGALRSGEGPTEVSFLTFGDPGERAAYATLVERFNASRDDIEVVMSHVPAPADYRARLAADFAAGSPPDVTLMNFRRIAAFLARDQLEPIGPYLERSETIGEGDFFPIALDAFRWKGEVACLPQNVSSLVVYYNRDLFDAAGLPYPADDWTWEDFVETAVALTVDRDGDGVAEQYGLGTEPTFFRAIPFIWQNGGEITDNPLFPRYLTLGEGGAQGALQWFVDLRQKHGVLPTRAEEAAMDSESRFIAGTTAMFLNSRRGTPTYREIDAFAWDVAPLPRGQLRADILHSDGYCLSAASAQKEAAWAFIEFANSAEGQRIVAETGRTVPSRPDAAESDAFLRPDLPPARSRVWLDALPTLRAVPVISTWDEIERAVDEEVERALYGEITVREAAFFAEQRTEEYFLMAAQHYPRE